jgi:hypothetical protein
VAQPIFRVQPNSLGLAGFFFVPFPYSLFSFPRTPTTQLVLLLLTTSAIHLCTTPSPL